MVDQQKKWVLSNRTTSLINRFTLALAVLVMSQALQLKLFTHFKALFLDTQQTMSLDLTSIIKYFELLVDSIKWHLGIGVVIISASFAIFKDLLLRESKSLFVKSLISISAILSLAYLGYGLYFLTSARLDLMYYLVHMKEATPPNSLFNFGVIVTQESWLNLILGLNISTLALLFHERVWRT